MESLTLLFIILGIFLGLVINAIWYYFNFFIEAKKYKLSGKYRFPIVVYFEHYHWATMLLIIGFRLRLPILIGVGLALLLDEGLAQQHRFALGSGHFTESLIIFILIIAFWIIVELLFRLVT